MTAPGYLLPVYLLFLAGFLLILNLKVRNGPGKWLSYMGMWAALAGSAAVAVVTYR